MKFGIKIEDNTPLENYWVIGDVHGCIFTLENLIKKLPKEAKPIFVGDLVDRGKHAKEVMQFVIGNNYLAVFGNHEYLMYNYARDAILRNIQSIWLRNEYGGYPTSKSYQNDIDILMQHINYIEKMPKYIEIDKYFITHGFGLPYYQKRDTKSKIKRLYTKRLEEYTKNELVKIQDQNNDIINIFGHTPYEKVLFGENYIGIDTGCVFGKKLSALNLGTHKVISEQTNNKDISKK